MPALSASWSALTFFHGRDTRETVVDVRSGVWKCSGAGRLYARTREQLRRGRRPWPTRAFLEEADDALRNTLFLCYPPLGCSELSAANCRLSLGRVARERFSVAKFRCGSKAAGEGRKILQSCVCRRPVERDDAGLEAKTICRS